MSNPFSSHNGGLSSPAAKIVPVTKHDDDDLPDGVCRALLVGTPGTANIIDASGTARSNVPLQQGFNPIGVQRVTTGGDADDIWALY